MSRSDLELSCAARAMEPEERILSAPALSFLSQLHRRFEPQRQELLAARRERATALSQGASLDFLSETRETREGDWRVASPPGDYLDRRVEITGPPERKLIINALNSGARGFMADFEDATAPTWSNLVNGQANLVDAVEGRITHRDPNGRFYELGDDLATLLARPRGWHLVDRHVRIDSEPISGSLLDFGLFAFHCGPRLVKRGRGIYLYLPKLEHHLEARVWDQVFEFTEEAFELDRGTIRATALVETLPAAFQMDEILFELRDHSLGLNAGRWDYIFSMIKCFRDRPDFVLPDRDQVTMTVPFMRAYTRLLVDTCHRRGAHAMGGMAALVPSRSDPKANARAIGGVARDKAREAWDGFDGTWVAHPDLVDVAQKQFERLLGNRPHQIDDQPRRRVSVAGSDLLDTKGTPGAITEGGLRNNVNVAFRYISSWLSGRGAAQINNLMEDAATAEICRAQLWQWARHSARLEDGRQMDRAMALDVLDQEMERIRAEVGEQRWKEGRPADTRAVLERVALEDDFPEFLTLVAYERLP
ncbi:MAG: malate synthase A [Solirubrobacterales bacterium]